MARHQFYRIQYAVRCRGMLWVEGDKGRTARVWKRVSVRLDPFGLRSDGICPQIPLRGIFERIREREPLPYSVSA